MASTVRLEALDGKWETVGVDRLRGIYAENVEVSANDVGSDTASFTLKRNPGGTFPDLSAFTPCDIDIDGVQNAWTGYVWETPTHEGVESAVNVSGRGWQYTMDDDSYADYYAHTDLSAWTDVRANINANLNAFVATPTIAQEQGGVLMGWGGGTNVATGHAVGVTLDLGKAESGWGIIGQFFQPTSSIAAADVTLYVRSHNNIDPLAGGTADFASPALSAIGLGNHYQVNGNLWGAYRYLTVMLYYSGPGGANGNTAPTIVMKQMHVFKRSRWSWDRASGGAAGAVASTALQDLTATSTLRASDVVDDAMQKAAPGIKPGTKGDAKFIDEVLGTPLLRGAWRMNITDQGSGSYVEDVAKVYQGTGADTGGGQRLLCNNGGGITGITAARGIIGTNDPTDEPDDGAWSRGALQFDGVNGWLQANDIDSSMQAGGYWLEAVFRPDTLPVTDGIVFLVGTAATSGYAIAIGVNAAGPGAGSTLKLLHCGVAWMVAGTALTAGNWYHVIMSRNAVSGTTTVWVNGTVTMQGVTVAPVAPAGAVVVASGLGSGGTNKVACTVDEVSMGYNGPFYADAITLDNLSYDHYCAALARRKGTIQRTTFNIPEFKFSTSAITPREAVQAVNAFHDWIFKIDADKRPNFQPRPTSAVYEIGNWSGADFEDASANAGEEMYNKVRVQGTGPDGQPLSVVRSSYTLAGVPLAVSSQQVANRSADVDASQWVSVNSISIGQGTLARDTGVYYSSPAALKLTPVANVYGEWGNADLNVDSAYWTAPQQFYAGITYVMTLRMARNGATAVNTRVRFGAHDHTGAVNPYQRALYNDYAEVAAFVPPNVASSSSAWLAGGSATLCTLTWTPTRNYTTDQVSLSIFPATTAGGSTIHWDDVTVYQARATILDKRLRLRSKTLPVQAKLTTPAANQIGDIYLSNHQSTPFKGTLIVGRGGVRTSRGGRKVHPAELLAQTGQKINFSHRLDPDTGAWGRLGDIASVTYNDAAGTATVNIDNQRSRFEALLERLAVVTGQIR